MAYISTQNKKEKIEREIKYEDKERFERYIKYKRSWIIVFYHRYVYVKNIGHLDYYDVCSPKNYTESKKGCLKTRHNQITSLASNDEYLYSASSDGLICVWNKFHQCVKKFNIHNQIKRYLFHHILHSPIDLWNCLPYIPECTPEYIENKISCLSDFSVKLYKELYDLLHDTHIPDLRTIYSFRDQLIVIVGDIFEVNKILVCDQNYKIFYLDNIGWQYIRKLKIYDDQIYLIIQKPGDLNYHIHVLNHKYEMIHIYDGHNLHINDICVYAGDIYVNIFNNKYVTFVKIPEFGSKYLINFKRDKRDYFGNFALNKYNFMINSIVIFRHNLWFCDDYYIYCMNSVGKVLYKYKFPERFYIKIDRFGFHEKRHLRELIVKHGNLYVRCGDRIVCLNVNPSDIIFDDDAYEKYHCFIPENGKQMLNLYRLMPPEIQEMIRDYF